MNPTPLSCLMGLDQVADLLSAAQNHTFTDRGTTRFYQGQFRAGAPFLIKVNTLNGTGHALRSSPRPALAANDPPT